MVATDRVEPQPSSDQQVSLWELRGISKSFPGVQALDSVSLILMSGEVHALLGENGSGKSTLCKCLSGVYQIDKGEIFHEGKPVTIADPLEARRYGVATIYQEFSLVPTLNVVENIFLGRPLRAGPLHTLNWGAMRRETVRILETLELQIDPDATVRSLSVAEQQLVEIAKALSLDSSLLIMDEPTAALGLGETQRLLALIKQLAAKDKAILYISHRLDEVFEVCDVATVFKDGKLVLARQPIRDLTMDLVVHSMVGVDIEQHYPKEVHTKPVPVLDVENLATANGVNGVSFTIYAGEVFGLGGMVGAGRTEIARAIFGIDRRTAGSVRLHGREVHFSSPAAAIAAGIGLVPENRKADGLFFNFEAPANITISLLKEILRAGVLNLRREREVGQEYVDKLRITKSAMDKSVQFLSGGNQQKVVIARWLYSQTRLLIFDEPTRGIDIGAKQDVYRVMNELTAQGISILLISSDYPELLAMSDRVAVVRDGRILHVAEGQRLTEYQLTAIASGAEVGTLAERGLRIRELAMPYLRDLRDRTRLTVHLAMLDDRDMLVLYLEKLACDVQTEQMASRTGASGPLHCTGVGKVLLAFAPSERVEVWVHETTLTQFTPNTITTPEQLLIELAEIRIAGYGLDCEEHEVGIGCIAAPIYAANNEAVAAISVSGVHSAFPAGVNDSKLQQQVTETAAQISQAMGAHRN